ncbi:hypothetical protein [Floccifex sp.]|uniref:hypothetical protein n=1 Tax=Floccifex sp. TaxID=2815810 RepID=UPI002A75159C|nr:hypothetical protein [Floccifex sp.]MDD7281920.1 hypothetical protein [Erysipelotrichaceae bacterium]MDY2958130.1 hypothetical protein [Floccifex sp.]
MIKKLLLCLLLLCGCSKSMDYIISHKEHITGIVTEVNEDSILIQNESTYLVSLSVENKDSMTHFNIGDEVVVYYDGTCLETNPIQINKVYAITLIQ